MQHCYYNLSLEFKCPTTPMKFSTLTSTPTTSTSIGTSSSPETSTSDYPEDAFSLKPYLFFHSGMAIRWSSAVQRMDPLRNA